ncbi:chromate transporter [Lacrimispora sp.]|uniref:chromate transporter n=1 Tax=Lacrimispora sp. TaxID=2719234 RepID=UPI0034600669
MKELLDLLWAFFNIGLFSIGGGYAVIPLIQQQVVEQAGWLTLQEYSDIIIISQMTPGPLAVNTSTFVGIRVLGIMGAVASTFGCVIGGCVISLVLYRWYMKHRQNKTIFYIVKGLKSASLGLIVSAGILMIFLAFFGTMEPDFKATSINVIALCIFGISFFLLRRYKMNPILILTLSGAAGIVFYYPW